MLHFDGTDLCMYSKRLENGRFAALQYTDRTSLPLRRAELELLLQGIHLIGSSASRSDDVHGSPTSSTSKPRGPVDEARAFSGDSRAVTCSALPGTALAVPTSLAARRRAPPTGPWW